MLRTNQKVGPLVLQRMSTSLKSHMTVDRHKSQKVNMTAVGRDELVSYDRAANFAERIEIVSICYFGEAHDDRSRQCVSGF